MTENRYLVSMSQNDKGIGFSAERALENEAKQPSNPIKGVKLINSTSKTSQLEVTLEDQNPGIIENAINVSGRMPKSRGTFKIESISQINNEQEEVIPGTNNDELARIYEETLRERDNLRKKVVSLERSNDDLKTKLRESSREINSALDGVLLYFETLDLSPAQLMEEPQERDYFAKVRAEETENTRNSYIRHFLGNDLKDEEIESALKYDEKESQKALKELDTKKQEAEEELEFLEKLKTIGVPRHLMPNIRTLIAERHPEQVIEDYQKGVEEKTKSESLYRKISKISKAYDSFGEKVSLLEQESKKLPLVWRQIDKDSNEIYFPFEASKLKGNFVEDLEKEMKSYLSDDSSIERISGSKFLAFSIKDAKKKGIYDFIADIPATLQTSGFNDIETTVIKA